MRRTVQISLVSCIWLGPAVLGAQTAPDTVPVPEGRDTTRGPLLAALRSAEEANRMVRVQSVRGAEVRGRIGVVADPFARIGGRQVDLREQARLEVRFSHPDPLWDGMAIGAVVTMPIGYVVARGLTEFGKERSMTSHEAVMAVASSAAFGALMGLFVDAAREGHPDWRLAWRRPAR